VPAAGPEVRPRRSRPAGSERRDARPVGRSPSVRAAGFAVNVLCRHSRHRSGDTAWRRPDEDLKGLLITDRDQW